MRRRHFLHLALARLATACRPATQLAQMAPTLVTKPAEALEIIDGHGHPRLEPGDDDGLARLEGLMAGGVTTVVGAVVGDRQWSRGKLRQASEFEASQARLRQWLDGPVAQGRVTLVTSARDLPGPGSGRPGLLLALEGGDPLEGREDRVDHFHALGVRCITLVHYRNNELGDIMHHRPTDPDPGPQHQGLTPAGRAVVIRMQQLGMLVDVAHTSAATLGDVLAVARKPVIDSHTGICRKPSGSCGRRRTWPEMEAVAAAGGVVCSWARGATASVYGFSQWAEEIMAMKARLGAAAIGLGTDNGGLRGAYVAGYGGWRDLPKLTQALLDAGMSRPELVAFCGGNLRRVLTQALG